ncbi:MAG: hypothetical protein JXX29_22410 [Deltaproteobacteria bacterium]|nr:hypothetical protein [Deltaproteobacteria bacterium]MBN2674450.1 hypothetical protein [Deltaproteobacteria bacterium]
MDLTPVEQWQLLSFLLHKGHSEMLDETECLVLHELQINRVGNSYQQVANAYPDTPPRKVIVQCSEDAIRFIDAHDNTLLLDWQGGLNSELVPWVYYNDLIRIDIDPPLFERLMAVADDFVARKSLIEAAPIDVTRRPSTPVARKWRKLRRDPVLFVNDFFKKWMK